MSPRSFSSAQPPEGGRPRAAAVDYRRYWSPVIRPMGEPLFDHLPLTDAAAILDVGTGTGAHLRTLKERAPAALVVGIDRWTEGLTLAREEGLPLVRMEADRFGFRASSFDLAIAIFVLHQLAEPLRALREMLSVVHRGGYVATVSWGEIPDMAADEVWEELLRGASVPDPPPDPGRDQIGSAQKLRAVLAEAGASGVEIWRQRFHHRWTPEGLIELRTSPSSRFSELPRPTQRQVLLEARRRFKALAPEDLVFQPEVVFSVARPTSDHTR